MAELKTTRNDADVRAFLDAVPDERRRREAREVCALMGEVTGEPPAMWGDSIVGFGQRRLRYDSGRELDWPLVGFSPRKGALTVYVMDGFEEYQDLLQPLGRHRTGKACLYLPRLDAVDRGALRDILVASAAQQRGSSAP